MGWDGMRYGVEWCGVIDVVVDEYEYEYEYDVC